MRQMLTGSLFFLLIAQSQATGSVILINPGLDDPPLIFSDVVDGWTLLEPSLDAYGYPENSAVFIGFTKHNGTRSLWYRPFHGGQFPDSAPQVDAHLYQDVVGSPGKKYTLSAWFQFEEHYSGLDISAPTQTILALEFRNGGGLISEETLDIDTVYVPNNTWQQFTVMGVAPPGTTTVRVRSSMIKGQIADDNPESAFVDDFSLTSVPEPTALTLAVLAWGAMLSFRRLHR